MLIAAPVVVPIVVVMALLIALRGGSPFYSQQRVGLSGRVFRIWKLRTMLPDADTLLKTHLEECEVARAEWTTTQKLKCDPRITRIGTILRKFSLDELPQLWNVLRGDMSLVGPRPMMVEQRPLYQGQGYFRVRPGITGLWQISSRNESDFSDRVHFDELYDTKLSLGGDAMIMLKTVGVVLRGTGY